MHESRFSQFSWQASGAGFLAAFVGFAGSFAVVLQGLHGAGANNTQAGSGLLFLSIAAGLSESSSAGVHVCPLPSPGQRRAPLYSRHRRCRLTGTRPPSAHIW